jgi:hypothetical protein
VDLVTKERRSWKTNAKNVKSPIEKFRVEENMLQGMHRSRF